MKKINVKNLFLLHSFLSINVFFFGQTEFDSISTWKKYRKQIYFGVGATQFLGDLGGGNTKGKKYGLGDIDWENTKYEFHVGYRYLFAKYLSLSTKLTLGTYAASDFYTTNFKRSQRKIDIKGSFVEWSERLEFVFYSHYLEKVIKEKKVCNRKEFYIFSGIGFLYFNSQAGKNSKYEGAYLRPLSTEGQGLPGGTIPYKNHSITIPFGIGMQKSFSRRRSIKFELTYIKTFSDYMDDTGGKYYDFQSNQVTSRPEAIYLSNPSEDWTLFKNGDERAGKGKDCFFYASFSFVKSLGLRKKRK